MTEPIMTDLLVVEGDHVENLSGVLNMYGSKLKSQPRTVATDFMKPYGIAGDSFFRTGPENMP